LLYFGVSGFLSFKKWQEMFFVPVAGARLKGTKYEYNFHLDMNARPMKSALLFGDNASGKTNWLYALRHFLNIINDGLQVGNQEYFNYSSSSIKFKIVVCNDQGIEYEYFLEYDRKGIILNEYLKKGDNDIFSFSSNTLKIFNDIENREQIQKLFSLKSTDTMLNKLKDWIDDLVLEFKYLASQILVEADDPINWAAKFFPMISIEKNEQNLIEEYSDEVLDVLRFIDSTIHNIYFEEILTKEGNVKYRWVVERLDGNESKIFPIANEAQGVKKMMYLLPSLLQIYKGKTIVIDELDSSIGTKSLMRIFNSIINSPSNTKGQLIVTSHNLNLLNLDMFHESQLQIFNKREDLGSIVNSIEQYDYRAVKKNLDEIYLKGGFNS